ncbi:MAG: hypothetical protein ACXWPX_10185 [Pseudobdellovibrio sp.]
MIKFVSTLFLMFSLMFSGVAAHAAAPMCQALFERKSAQEMLEQINDRYEQAFYKNTPDENIQKSFFLAKKYKLWRLKRMFKQLAKNASSYDKYDINQFVYKLDQLAFADTVLNDPETSKNLSARDLQVLSEARRQVLADGIVKYFGIDQNRTGFWKQAIHYLSESASWKYWRWTQAAFYMPKLVGLSVPPELAEKLLLDGIEPHRAELERVIPNVRNREYFNQFSKFYNAAVLVSLLTVVPYMTHNYYVEQMHKGDAQAAQILQPLVQTTDDMSKINYMEQEESGAVEKYIDSYTAKYGSAPSADQVQQVKVVIHARILAETQNPDPK